MAPSGSVIVTEKESLTAIDDASTAVRTEYSMFERGGYKRIGYELTPEVWERVEASIGEIVEGIEAGWFPQRPERPGFRLWTSCHYCEPDGLGTAEAWGRWQQKQHDERVARWFGQPVDDDADPADMSHGQHDG